MSLRNLSTPAKRKSSEVEIKVPKELTHGPFAVDTESLMFPGITLFFLAQPNCPKAKNEPVFSMYNLLLKKNFISVQHFEQLSHSLSFIDLLESAKIIFIMSEPYSTKIDHRLLCWAQFH